MVKVIAAFLWAWALLPLAAMAEADGKEDTNVKIGRAHV